MPRDDPTHASLETLTFVAGCPPEIQRAIIGLLLMINNDNDI